MYPEIRVLNEFGFAPLSALDAVVGFDVAIDCVNCKLKGRSDCCLFVHAFAYFEANVVPICRAVSTEVDTWSDIVLPMVSTGGGGKGIVETFWGQMV